MIRSGTLPARLPWAGLLLATALWSGFQIQDPYADAVRLFDLGRYDQAARRLETIVQGDRLCMECYDLLARIATIQGNDSLAAVWYRQALQVEPESATLYGLLGLAEHRAGDLQQAVVVEREDEIGLLAGAFNSMTTQLRELISSLEGRVKERTEALRRRALQMETSMRVSRDLTASILDIDELLTRVVELIREAF